MRCSLLVSLALVLHGCGDDGGFGLPDAAVDAAADTASDAVADTAPLADAAADAMSDAAPDAMVDASSDGGLDGGVPASRLDDLIERLAAATATSSGLDELLHEVAWAEGWPVSDGERYLFATRWDGAPGSVAWVSDANAWEPSAHPASSTAGGAHYYVVVPFADFVVAAAGAKYKWYGAGDVFRPGPEARAYGYDGFGEFGWVAPPTDQPWLERFGELSTPHLDRARTVRARLPAGFTRSAGASMRTLLMHDGQNVFDPGAFFGGWQLDVALEGGAYDDVVVIAVDNAPDRFDAYTHVADEIEAGGGAIGGRADDYLALLDEDVLPWARARYGVRALGDDLAVAGSSLGGLVTLYWALTHDGDAGCVMALSSTLGWGAFGASATGADALVRRWSELGHGGTAIYLDSGGSVTGACGDGDGDGVHEDADQSDNYCTTLQLRDTLLAAGYTSGADLFYAWEPSAPHNEAAWRARIPGALSACTTAGWLAP